MEREEMVQILEEIIRDPAAPPTARCTAIRTLRVFPKPPALDESPYDENNVLPMTGPVARANKRRKAER